MSDHCSACNTHLVLYESQQRKCQQCGTILCSSCHTIKVKLEQIGTAKPGTCASCHMVTSMKSQITTESKGTEPRCGISEHETDSKTFREQIYEQGTLGTKLQQQNRESKAGNTAHQIADEHRLRSPVKIPHHDAKGSAHHCQRKHSSQSDSSDSCVPGEAFPAMSVSGKNTRDSDIDRAHKKRENTSVFSISAETSIQHQSEDSKLTSGHPKVTNIDQSHDEALKTHMLKLLNSKELFLKAQKPGDNSSSTLHRNSVGGETGRTSIESLQEDDIGRTTGASQNSAIRSVNTVPFETSTGKLDYVSKSSRDEETEVKDKKCMSDSGKSAVNVSSNDVIAPGTQQSLPQCAQILEQVSFIKSLEKQHFNLSSLNPSETEHGSSEGGISDSDDVESHARALHFNTQKECLVEFPSNGEEKVGLYRIQTETHTATSGSSSQFTDDEDEVSSKDGLTLSLSSDPGSSDGEVTQPSSCHTVTISLSKVSDTESDTSQSDQEELQNVLSSLNLEDGDAYLPLNKRSAVVSQMNIEQEDTDTTFPESNQRTDELFHFQGSTESANNYIKDVIVESYQPTEEERLADGASSPVFLQSVHMEEGNCGLSWVKSEVLDDIEDEISKRHTDVLGHIHQEADSDTRRNLQHSNFEPDRSRGRKVSILGKLLTEDHRQTDSAPLVFVAHDKIIYTGQLEATELPAEGLNATQTTMSKNNDEKKSSNVADQQFSDPLSSGLGSSPEDDNNLCNNLLPGQISNLARYRDFYREEDTIPQIRVDTQEENSVKMLKKPRNNLSALSPLTKSDSRVSKRSQSTATETGYTNTFFEDISTPEDAFVERDEEADSLKETRPVTPQSETGIVTAEKDIDNTGLQRSPQYDPIASEKRQTLEQVWESLEKENSGQDDNQTTVAETVSSQKEGKPRTFPESKSTDSQGVEDDLKKMQAAESLLSLQQQGKTTARREGPSSTSFQSDPLEKKEMVENLLNTLGALHQTDISQGPGLGNNEGESKDTPDPQNVVRVFGLLQTLMMVSARKQRRFNRGWTNPFFDYPPPDSGDSVGKPGSSGSKSTDCRQLDMLRDQMAFQLMFGGPPTRANSSKHMSCEKEAVQTLLNTILDSFEREKKGHDPKSSAEKRALFDKILNALSVGQSETGNESEVQVPDSVSSTTSLPNPYPERHRAMIIMMLNSILEGKQRTPRTTDAATDSLTAQQKLSKPSDHSQTSVTEQATEVLEMLQAESDAEVLQEGPMADLYGSAGTIRNSVANLLLFVIDSETKKEKHKGEEMPSLEEPVQAEVTAAGITQHQSNTSDTGNHELLPLDLYADEFSTIAATNARTDSYVQEMHVRQHGYPNTFQRNAVQAPLHNQPSTGEKRRISKLNKNAAVSRKSSQKKSSDSLVNIQAVQQTQVAFPLPSNPPPTLNTSNKPAAEGSSVPISSEEGHGDWSAVSKPGEHWHDNPAYENSAAQDPQAQQEWVGEGALGEANIMEDPCLWQSLTDEDINQAQLKQRQVAKNNTSHKNQTIRQPMFKQPVVCASHSMHEVLRSTAQSLNLYIHSIPSDGNCMFNAVVDQLRIRGNLRYNHRTLRAAAVKFLRNNPYHEDGTHKDNFLSGEDWESYLIRMAQPKEWGEHLMISAVAEVLNVTIRIVTVTMTDCTRTEITPTSGQSDSYHTITIGLKGEYHFESLRPYDWQTKLVERAVSPHHKPTQKTVKQSKPTLAFAAMLAEGRYLTSGNTGEYDEVESEESEDGDEHIAAVENYSSQQLMQTDSNWDPLADISTSHISYIIRLMISTDKITLLSPSEDLKVDEESDSHSEYGDFIVVGPVFDSLEVAVRHTYNYHHGEYYDQAYQSNSGEIFFVPKDSEVIETSRQKTKATKCDLFADNHACCPGNVRLRPVSEDVWSHQLASSEDGKVYLKKIRIMESQRKQKKYAKRANESEEKKEKIMAFACKQWPNLASDWVGRSRRSGWPDTSVIKEVKSVKCHVIPAIVDPELQEGMLEYDTLWQYSFACPESMIMKYVNEWQLHCFHVLAVLLQEFLPGFVDVLSSQNLKNVFLLACEEIPEDMWQRNPGACLLYILDMILIFLKNRHLPSYFMPAVDLIKHLPEDIIRKVYEELQGIRKFFGVFLVVFLQRYILFNDVVLTGILDTVLHDARLFKRHKNLNRSINECFTCCTVELAKTFINRKGYLMGLGMLQKAFEEWSSQFGKPYKEDMLSDFVNDNITFGLEPIHQWIFMFFCMHYGHLRVRSEILTGKEHTTLGKMIGAAAQNLSQYAVPSDVAAQEFDFLCCLTEMMMFLKMYMNAEQILRYIITVYGNKIIDLGIDEQQHYPNTTSWSHSNPNYQCYVKQNARNVAILECYWRLWGLYQHINQAEQFLDLVDPCVEQCDKICQKKEYNRLVRICRVLRLEEKAIEIEERIRDRTDTGNSVEDLD